MCISFFRCTHNTVEMTQQHHQLHLQCCSQHWCSKNWLWNLHFPWKGRGLHGQKCRFPCTQHETSKYCQQWRFRQLHESGESGYSLTWCDTVMHTITSKYNTEKEVILVKIKSCAVVRSLQTYEPLTKWRVTWPFVLETKVKEASHTAANITEPLCEVMAKRELLLSMTLLPISCCAPINCLIIHPEKMSREFTVRGTLCRSE